MFVQKLDASGNFLWAKAFGGPSLEFSYSIAVDDSGQVYTTGYFQDTVDFDPGPGTANLNAVGNEDMFVQKLDASGNFLWAKAFGGPSFDQGRSIAVDASGQVYITGYFTGTVDFDPGADTANLTAVDNDIFVQKLDASGNFLWAKAFGGFGAEAGESIAVDTSGQVYTTGWFGGTADFDPGAGTANLSAVGGWDIFVQKLDASGNFLWAKAFGGPSFDEGTSLAVDASGQVYTTGWFGDTVDFDPGVGTAHLSAVGSSDIFVQKLDASGNFLWAKAFGGPPSDYGRSLAVDDSGQVYTTGWFGDTVDFDPGAGTANLSAVGDEDIFVQKLDASGNFLWAKSFGGPSSDLGWSLAVNDSGQVYTTGSFKDTVDFDPGADTANLNAVGLDIFIQKMSPCAATAGIDVQTACDSYTWLDGNTYTASNNSATFTLPNVAGCDSVVTLDLTITNSTSATDVITACDSYTWIDGNTYTASNNSATFTLPNAAGCDSVVTLDLTINGVADVSTTLAGVTIAANNPNATYQWLDCDDNFAPISGETNQAFTATSNGAYAVALTEGGCVDTSDCVMITAVGLPESDPTDGAITLFPNPAPGSFTLQSPRTTLRSVAIFDLAGRQLPAEINLDRHEAQVLSDYRGLVIVKVQTQRGVWVRKVRLE